MLKLQRILLGLGISLVIAPSVLAQNTETWENSECFNTLVKADELYQAGEMEQAKLLYQQCKDDFLQKTTNSPLDIIKNTKKEDIQPPIYELKESDRGYNLWQETQEGIEHNRESKVYFNLIALTKIVPEFIPAYLALADFCVKEPEFCKKSAKSDQPKSASEVLERVTEIYPDDTELLTKKIELMLNEDKYLQASISARQFAIVYDDHPDAPKFKKLADDYLGTFEKKIRQQLNSQVALTILGSGFSAVVLNDPSKSLRGIEMIIMLAQGESGFGKQAVNSFANSAREQGKLVEDPVVIDYIRGIATRMTPYMGRNFEYEFYVIQDDSINAFALPGGKVVVNTGAILAADSESEIAGLLGHEISHAVLSHGFLKVIQANFIGSISDVFGSVGQLEQSKSFIDYMAPLITSAYSREAEKQADILGARALVLAGYSADGLRDFMLKIKAESGDRPTSYLDSHPAPVDRVQYLQQIIVNNGYDRYAYMGVKKHQLIKQRLQNPNAPMESLPENTTNIAPNTSNPNPVISPNPPTEDIEPLW